MVVLLVTNVPFQAVNGDDSPSGASDRSEVSVGTRVKPSCLPPVGPAWSFSSPARRAVQDKRAQAFPGLLGRPGGALGRVWRGSYRKFRASVNIQFDARGIFVKCAAVSYTGHGVEAALALILRTGLTPWFSLPSPFSGQDQDTNFPQSHRRVECEW